MDDDLSTFRRIVALLDSRGCEYTILEHDHVHTSEDAAKVRGTRLEEAAKALVLKTRQRRGSGTPVAEDRTHDTLFLCVVSGHKRLDLKRIKALLSSKDVSLAHPDEVFRATGCKVGTVPPFPVLFGLPGYCDAGVLENEHVVFSAASHYKSIRMKAADWKDAAGVTVERLAGS